MDDFDKRCAKIAERFLLTAVIVDDEAQIPDAPRPTGSLRTPGRHSLAGAQDESIVSSQVNVNSLDARAIVESFARSGLICAVIAPSEDDMPSAAAALRVARRADMVILDWQLHRDDGVTAIGLLTDLLKEGEAARLRLVAIYTGQDNLSNIGETLSKKLSKQGWNFQSDELHVELSYEHCRIVIYAKSDTRLAPDLTDRAISEDNIAKRLIEDFADMTKGLLPSIALTSLAAVRENAHRVLDSFSPDLDPAFLAHRACLSSPEDSQQHMVSLLESELNAIVNDATMEVNPAGFDAVKDWLYSNFSQDSKFQFEKNELSVSDVLHLLEEGLDLSSLGRQDYRYLSSKFAKNGNGSEDLDHHLAWMFNFRTVSNSLPPVLQLGTALENQNRDGGSEFFLCMRPRCDSVRLQSEERFPLLPLINPKQKQMQLVVKKAQDDYLRLSVCTSPTQWLLPEFAPDNSRERVVAAKADDGQFFFTCKEGKRFKWIGELKADFAQRVAQHFASGLSRVATDNSEWLRRRERSRG